jgi:hypothetical protein
VPTTRPRHSITETDLVRRALDDAGRRWPGESRGQLLLRLVEEGHRALAHEQEQDRERRLAALRRTSGALTGVYPEGYLAELRGEWPE